MKKLLAVLVILSAAVPAQAIGIAKHGVFSSGGTVTAPLSGDFNAAENWLDFSRAGNTAHGREGWSDFFLRKGRAAFLVDQPRRGAAGSTVSIVNNEQDTRADGKEYNFCAR